jgi:hypothetical protein
MTTDNFCFYLQNKLNQTSQTGGQWYNDASPFSIPCPIPQKILMGSILRVGSSLPWGLYHRTYYGRNLRISVIS